jgi:hypothetical protein
MICLENKNTKDPLNKDLAGDPPETSPKTSRETRRRLHRRIAEDLARYIAGNFAEDIVAKKFILK